MGAEVQSKTYFPGSMTDVNNGFHNGVWDLLYHDDKTHNISSAPAKNQHYDYFLTPQPMGELYAKEQIKQTILKHESIFKHQIQELHRLYKRQRDLMNPVPVETSNFGHFLSQLPSNVNKETCIFASSFPLADSGYSRASTLGTDNMFSRLDSIKGKNTSKNGISERRVIDLELPADVDEVKEGKLFNLADLNEPIQVEEKETAFSAFFSNKNRTDCLADVTQKRDLSAKRTLFGVEIGERNHTPTFHSSNRQLGAITRDSSSVVPWRTTTSSVHHNHWINSSDSTRHNPGLFAGNSSLMTNSVSDSLQKHRFLDMWKNHETPEQTLPSWLTAKSCLQNEQTKPKVHHINMDSLQNHSQLFFKKTETAEGNNDTRVFKKLKTDDTRRITKILGVSIIDIEPKVELNCDSNEKKHYIDLNMSLDEEDAPPSFPESVVKIATMEIDLEAPAVLESDTDDTHLDLVKLAAEAIVSISTCQEPSPDDTLMWFAEVITSNDIKKNKKSIHEIVDYFEYMTLKLEENYESYKPTIVEEKKEEDSSLLSKRTTRKGQGRRRKDFQKDVLPSIVSLSRREVSEDIQIFEQVFCATGVSWQSSLSKRRSAGRGRRRMVVPPVVVAGGGERSVCRELSLEKSLGGWGRRTRRLPRQRCGNHQSFALKC